MGECEFKKCKFCGVKKEESRINFYFLKKTGKFKSRCRDCCLIQRKEREEYINTFPNFFLFELKQPFNPNYCSVDLSKPLLITTYA